MSDPHFLRLSVNDEHRQFAIRLNRLSIQQTQHPNCYGDLYLASGCGTSTAVKAFAATLNSRKHYWMHVANWPGHPKHEAMMVHPSGHGYTIHRALLGLDQWHVLAITKDPAFLPAATEGRLWQALKSDQFTTPLLRHWVGPLAKRLRARKWLFDARNYRAKGVVLAIPAEKKLDELVSEGVHSGELTLEER